MSAVLLIPCTGGGGGSAPSLNYNFYTPDGTIRDNIEPGDFFTGVVDGFYIEGIYNGPDLLSLDNFNIATQHPLNINI